MAKQLTSRSGTIMLPFSRFRNSIPRLAFSFSLLSVATLWIFTNSSAQAQTTQKNNAPFPPTERKELGTKWKVSGKVTIGIHYPVHS